MDVVNVVAEIRHRVAAWKTEGLRVGLVPTMGNLHEGHLQLITEMQRRADRVLVSIFVNPLQFGASEDFSSYPRTFETDCEKLAELNVDVVFAPSTEEVYPDGVPLMTEVSVPALADKLCGEFRPGHFTGVATVVAKLFNLMQPDVAIFGKKDYQQLTIICRMVRDLNFPVEIVAAPTVRDSDGLAKSSRNGYLTSTERGSARLLYAVLESVAGLIRRGARDFSSIESQGINSLNDAGFRPEYLSVRRQADLAVPGPEDRELVVVAAVWLGRTRLIDNIEVRTPARS